ncbi:hypothetical protein EBT31_03390 [bacterium]|nr:hypothetical protein [bacterium]
MASKPKAADYKASEAEKASASVSMAEAQYFKEKYDPLLQQMRDKSLTEDIQSGLRGRANADVMQALSAPSYEAATSSTAASDTAQALTGQLGAANVAAKQVQNTMQSGVLGTARGQVADAQSGMAQASRLATSSALERARGKQEVALAKQSAAGQVAATAIAKAAENKASGGTWFTPKDPKTGLPVSSIKDRLAYSTYGTAAGNMPVDRGSLSIAAPQFFTPQSMPTLSTPVLRQDGSLGFVSNTPSLTQFRRTTVQGR